MKIAALLVAGVCATWAQTPPTPTYIPQTKFERGQDVVPSFDGWIKNADGTFTLVFGYFNRNYVEEVVIPPGAENQLDPGPADQGQPTYFLPRRHAWAFRVKVPADFGNKEIVWTVTAHGRTEKAYGHLYPAEEIIERLIQSRGNLSPGTDDPNKPPTVSIAPVEGASAGTPVMLTALVSDDGLPKPRAPKERKETKTGTAQSNSATPRQRMGLSVSWMQYRGPAKVTFDVPGPSAVADGKARVTARFSQPGEYVLRATANDGELQTTADVKVVVR